MRAGACGSLEAVRALRIQQPVYQSSNPIIACGVRRQAMNGLRRTAVVWSASKQTRCLPLLLLLPGI
jgi:hypothetical protein